MIYEGIIKYIYNYFGVPKINGSFSILSNKYLLNQKIQIELEDGEKIQKQLWGLSGKVSNSIIRALLADISSSDDEALTESVLLLQLDSFSIYALVLNKDDNNKAYVLHDDTWIEISMLLLAKLLVGIEQLNEILIDYVPLNNYQDLHKKMIDFVEKH